MKQNRKSEEFKRRLKTAIYFFSEKEDYERNLSELKLAGNMAITELNKKIKKEQEMEFEKNNVKLPL